MTSRDLTIALPYGRYGPRNLQNVAWQAAAVAAVLILAVLAFIAVRSTGGSPNPLNHLGYLPIVLAAYLFGWRGSLPAAALVTLLLGPLALWLSLPGGNEGLEAWAVRGVIFLGVGMVTGYLFDRVQHTLEQWRSTVVTVVDREREAMVALARGAEAKDGDTGDHVVRVQLLSAELATAIGLDGNAAASIGWSAMLHDVGKLHVPDSLLLKPGPLSPAEWEIMRGHPIWGAEILAHGEGFEVARRIARWHHENFDGSGYPDGLAGEAIPLEARIVRVADAFDAMTNDRPYRSAQPVSWALEELRRGRGGEFDPDIVDQLEVLLGTSRLLVELREHRLAALVRPMT